MNLLHRENIVNDIKNNLLFSFNKKEIISAFVYGSTLSEDFCETSDFDILVIFRESSIKNLEKLKSLRKTFALKKIKVDFNVHDQNDLPVNRKDAFWHNNRSIYLRKEIELYGRTIIGKNVFALTSFDEELLQLEVVRVLSSLVYQTRKYFINKTSDRKNLIQILKWCIYAVQYSLAYKNIFPSSKLEAIKVFKTIFKTKTDPEKFLILKIGKDQISTNHIKKAYEFLCEIDLILLKDWKLKNDN